MLLYTNLSVTGGGKLALFKRLQNWLYDRPTKVLGIDFSHDALKIVSMKMVNSPCAVDKMAAFDWPLELQNGGWVTQPEVTGDFLKSCLTKQGFSGTRAVVSAGSQVAFVREIDFPVMNETELESAMQWDAEQYIPMEPGSYYYDYLSGGKGNSDLEMKVLLFAASKEWIDSVERTLAMAGVRLLAVETEAVAVKRLVPDLQDFLLLDMGARTSQLTVFQRGWPVAQRNIPLGGAALTNALAEKLGEELEEAERIKRYRQDAAQLLCQFSSEEESVFTELGREVQRTADYYRVNNAAALFSTVVVTGGGWLSGCEDSLASFLHVSVRTLRPFSALSLSREQWDADYLTRLEGRMAVCVGLCLREAREHEAQD